MAKKPKLTSKGAKIVAALEEFRDALRDGVPIEERFRVTRVRRPVAPDRPEDGGATPRERP